MKIQDLFKDVEEKEIGGSQILTSPFLEFILKKDRQFFSIKKLTILDKNYEDPKIILNGIKYFNGGLIKNDWELIYTKKELEKFYNIYNV